MATYEQRMIADLERQVLRLREETKRLRARLQARRSVNRGGGGGDTTEFNAPEARFIKYIAQTDL